MLCDSFFNSSVSFADSSLFKGSLSYDFTNNKRQLIASLCKGRGTTKWWKNSYLCFTARLRMDTFTFFTCMAVIYSTFSLILACSWRVTTKSFTP